MTAQYGIIGYPLGHSFSPGYFKRKFEAEGIDAVYDAFALTEIALFPELLRQQAGLRGLSVTIPYKEAVMPYLDEADEAAMKIGAVNCIALNGGKTKGYNTDIIGFEQSIVPLLQPWHKTALVLGTGGASKAVAWVLGQLGISYQKVSRSRSPGILCYEDVTAALVAATPLIVNTSPVGQYPHADGAPVIPYSAVGRGHLLYDLIYNPVQTKFLQQGGEREATTCNGLEMLELQAEAAWRIWNQTGAACVLSGIQESKS